MRVAPKHVAFNYTRMGPAGAGQTTKLINQVLCGLGFLVVAEATQLALDAGVDAAKIPQALKGGRADSALCDEIHRMLTAAGHGGEDQAAVMEYFKGAKEEFGA